VIGLPFGLLAGGVSFGPFSRASGDTFLSLLERDVFFEVTTSRNSPIAFAP
jgi:hypothetical protein